MARLRLPVWLGLALTCAPLPARAHAQGYTLEAPAPMPAIVRPEMVLQTGHIGPVETIAFSPDGRTLVSGSSDRTAILLDVATGARGYVLGRLPESVKRVAFSPDGRTVATGTTDSVTLWDAATGQKRATLDGTFTDARGPVDLTSYCMAFSPDGRTLASGGNFGTVTLWATDTGARRALLAGHQTKCRVESVAFSPDGRTLACATDNCVVEWDLVTGARHALLTVQRNRVTSVAFSADGRVLASGSEHPGATLWDAATGVRLREFPTGYPVLTMALDPAGRILASQSTDWSVILWDATTGQKLRTLTGHTQGVSCLAFSPDGGTLAAAAYDRTLRIWDVATGSQRAGLDLPPMGCACLAFNRDGRSLAFISGKSEILWDLTTGQWQVLAEHRSPAFLAAFSRDGRTLAWVWRWGDQFRPCYTVSLLNAETRGKLRDLDARFDHIRALEISPNGRMASSSPHPSETAVPMAGGLCPLQPPLAKGHEECRGAGRPL